MSIATTGLIVEMARTSQPLATTPTWTAITSRVLALSIDRGRATPHDRFGGGSITLEVDNSDRAFDRTFTTGPYYGTQFDVGMRIRVRESVYSQTLATGWVDDWPMAWGRVGAGTVQLQADEIFRLLGDTTVWLDRPEEDPSTRLGAILGTIPSGLRDFDPGTCRLQAGIYQGTQLELAQMVAESDGGVLVPGRDGKVVFHDRHAPFEETRQNTSQWTFSPSGTVGTVPYASPSVGPRRGLLFNRAVMSRAGSWEPPVEVEDTTSSGHYGPRGRSASDLVHVSVTDTKAIAEMFVQSWSSPGEPATLTLHPTVTTDKAYEVLTKLDLRDLVTVEWSPGNATPRNSSLMTVESISIRATATEIAAVIGLAPARIQTLAGSMSVYAQANSTAQANSSKKAAP